MLFSGGSESRIAARTRIVSASTGDRNDMSPLQGFIDSFWTVVNDLPLAGSRAGLDPCPYAMVSFAVKLDAVLAMLHEERELPNEET